VGPSAWTLAEGCAVIDSIERTPDLVVEEDFTSLLKKELSFDNLILKEVNEASTSGFHLERHFSNENAADSSVATHCS
jgi:hypothetical protein